MTARKRKAKRRKVTAKHQRKVAALARQHQKSYQPGAR